MKKFLLSFTCLSFAGFGAGQSISLVSASSTHTLPGSGPFLSLTSPGTQGSYWMDFRVTNWSMPTAGGCQSVVTWPGANNNLQLRLCPAAAGWVPFTIATGSDIAGGPVSIGPPHLTISSATATNPMVLTLASAPFPVTMAVGKTITIYGVLGTGCSGMNANQTITAVSPTGITINYDGTGCSYAPNTGGAYSQDFLFRYHRDLVLMQAIGETWNVDGTGYAIQSMPISSAPPVILNQPIYMGPGNVSFAYFRWYLGTIPVNSRAPWGKSANAGTTVLADWEFDGNGNDASGNGLTLSFSPSATYATSPVYAPACSPGPAQTWRAGTSGSLDGSRSFPLDGGESIKYTWQQIASAEPGVKLQHIRWNSHTIPNPTISGFAAGPLNFRLTVTDGNGVSNSCTVHDGAVATDDAGNILISDSKIASIIGPLTMANHNTRWPWFDVIERQWADEMGQAQGSVHPGKLVPDFTDSWNVAQPGTVSITNGTYRFIGTGTTFQSTFCDGGKFASYYGKTTMIVWYPKAGLIGGTGRRMKTVGKCVSDTVIDYGVQYSDDNGSSNSTYNLDAPSSFAYTSGASLIWRPGISCAGGPTTVNVNGLGPVPLKKPDGATDPSPTDCASNSNVAIGINLAYNGSVFTIQGQYKPLDFTDWRTTPGTISGVQYAASPINSLGDWVGGSSSMNFYDNVLAFYTMYYRTGIDTYLGYARWLADRWWTLPYNDQGNANDGGGGNPLLPRQMSMTGIFLRAIDQDNVNGTPGSSLIWAGIREFEDTSFRTTLTPGVLIGDLRETAYNAMWVAMCAAYDPDPVHAAACRSDLNHVLTETWQKQRQPDGSWQSLAGTACNITASSFGGCANVTNATATVTPGSNIVTLQGGKWDASWFPAEFFSVGNAFDSTTRDTGYYNATYVDDTHIRLDRNYSDVCGSTCSGRTWVVSTGAPGSAWIGFGTQPFMLGITGQLFSQAYIGLNKDPQYSAMAATVKSYVLDITKWLTTTGTAPYARGLWYGIGFGICTGPSPAASCYAGGPPDQFNVVQSRELSPEVLGLLAVGYSYAPSPELQAEIDNLYSAVYAKYQQDPGFDGAYAQDIDPDNGGYFYGALSPKWNGFFWGMGRNAAWLGARQGGPAASQPVTVYISGDLATVPQAKRMRVTVTDPTGVTRDVECASAPCPITVDRTLGNPLAQVTYLSADGRVLTTGEPQLVTLK